MSKGTTESPARPVRQMTLARERRTPQQLLRGGRSLEQERAALTGPIFFANRSILIRVSGQGFDALVEHANGRERRLRGARLLVILPLTLISSLTTIILLAYAYPPDPTWIPGIYDNADHDDVVGLVTDGAGASNAQRPARIAEGPGTCGVLQDLGKVPSRMLSAEMSRGPPSIEASSLLWVLPNRVALSRRVCSAVRESCPAVNIMARSLMLRRTPPWDRLARLVGRSASMIPSTCRKG
jgi:hypothetical protein